MAPVADRAVSAQRVLALRPGLRAHVPVLTADHLGITTKDDQKDDQKGDQAGDPADDRADDRADVRADGQVEAGVTVVTRRLIR